MKVKIWILSLVCICIISYGIIKVSTETLSRSEIINDNAKVKILYSKDPFNFQIENDKYIFYINKEVITDIKNKSAELYNNFIGNFKLQ